MMFNIRLFLNIVTNYVPINLVLLWKLRWLKNKNNLSSTFSCGEIENVHRFCTTETEKNSLV